MRKRFAILCAASVVALLAAWAFFGRRSVPGPVRLDVGFFGYTNGFMGKRFACISVTNRSDKPVRLLPQYELEYGAPLAGRIGGGDLTERVLRHGEAVATTVEVLTQPNRAQWRLHLKTSWATPSERSRRWWDRYSQAHRWTWWLPYPFRADTDSTFTTVWFVPDLPRNAER